MEKENKKSSTVVRGYLYQETGGKYSLTKDLYKAQNKHYIPIYSGETSNLIDLIQKFEEECRISENLIEDNKVNLSEQEKRYEDVHPLGLGMNDPSINPAFRKKH